MPIDALPPSTAFVDAFVFDINGQARGKRLPAQSWPAIVRDGVGFSASALVLDARGHAQGPLGIGTADGDPDATARPLPGLLAPVPWSAHGLAQCPLAMADVWFDPRAVLAGVIARCRADGLHPVVACELEFYLLPEAMDARAPPAGHLGLQEIEDNAAFLHALHGALAAQGIPAETLVSEYGPGQFELNLRHTGDPLLAADQAALQRRATLGVARAQGRRASFMGKPFAREAGSGLHIHVSLADAQGRNLFAGEDDTLLHRAIAGCQALHAESMLIFAPNFSAYRRYRAGAFVSLNSAWGENSRAVAFRIPRSPRAARRIEHRLASAEASPHLVLAAVLAALHHGVTAGLAPTAPATGPADHAPDALVPNTIFAAIAAMERSRLLAAYLPPRFPALLAAVRRGETADLLDAVMPIEHEFYL